MNTTEHPRLLARIAGSFYLAITAFALFAYLYVRGQLIVSGDMAQTATNILAHERLYRLGFGAALVVVMCNLPLGLILFELLKVVQRRLALLALLFIVVSTTIEAVNVLNYFQTLIPLTQPEYLSAFDASQRQALARASIRLFGVTFSVSLCFFGVFCLLVGYLLFRSSFFPAILGVLMAIAGLWYLVNSFVGFLALPPLPRIPLFLSPSIIAEVSLALWLLVVSALMKRNGGHRRRSRMLDEYHAVVRRYFNVTKCRAHDGAIGDRQATHPEREPARPKRTDENVWSERPLRRCTMERLS